MGGCGTRGLEGGDGGRRRSVASPDGGDGGSLSCSRSSRGLGPASSSCGGGVVASTVSASTVPVPARTVAVPTSSGTVAVPTSASTIVVTARGSAVPTGDLLRARGRGSDGAGSRCGFSRSNDCRNSLMREGDERRSASEASKRRKECKGDSRQQERSQRRHCSRA